VSGGRLPSKASEQPPNPLYRALRAVISPRWAQRANGSPDETRDEANTVSAIDCLADNAIDPSRALTYCFLRLANLDNGAFKRLNRYEAALATDCSDDGCAADHSLQVPLGPAFSSGCTRPTLSAKDSAARIAGADRAAHLRLLLREKWVGSVLQVLPGQKAHERNWPSRLAYAPSGRTRTKPFSRL
jgi:hypothetical protein